MKNKTVKLVFTIVVFFSFFIYTAITSGKRSKKDHIIFGEKFHKYKPLYESYAFQGKVIDYYHFNGGRDVQLIILTNKKITTPIKPCCRTRFLVQKNDSILEIEFLSEDKGLISFKKGGEVIKKKNSTSIYYR